MNQSIKITFGRIILTIIMLIILLFPFYSVGINFPKYLIGGIVIDTKYIIAGIIFIIASLLDLINDYMDKKKKNSNDTSKMFSSISDKFLVNSTLITFASVGFISPIIPVVVVARDIFVDAIKMETNRNGKAIQVISSGKIKTFAMMVGLVLMFFYNIPFEFINIRIDLFLIYFATIMSIVSMIEYYTLSKNILFPKNEKL